MPTILDRCTQQLGEGLIVFFDLVEDYPAIGGVAELSRRLASGLAHHYGDRLVAVRTIAADIGCGDRSEPYLDRERRAIERLAALAPRATFFIPNFQNPLTRKAGVARPATVNIVHDVQFAALPELFSEGRRRWLHTAFAETRANADHIAFVSRATRDDFVDLFGAPMRTSVVPPPLPTWVRSGPPVPSAGVLLAVQHGECHPHKNVAGLLALFTGLAERCATLTLRVAGRGEAAFQRATTHVPADVRRRVEHVGYVSPAELDRLYGSADAFLSLSRFEGFNMAAAEAAVRGVPLLLSDLPAHRESFADTACFLDPDRPDLDRAAAFLADRAPALRGRAWRRAEACETAAVVRRHVEILDALGRPTAAFGPGRWASPIPRRAVGRPFIVPAARPPRLARALLAGTMLSGVVALGTVTVARPAVAAQANPPGPIVSGGAGGDAQDPSTGVNAAGGPGGTGYSGAAGQDGSTYFDGSTYYGGGGGGGAAGSGLGGAGGSDLQFSDPPGGNGGQGGANGTTVTTLDNSTTLTGGAGQDGVDEGPSLGGGGGGGGGGGYGAIVTGGATLNANSGDIFGANGGAGGSGYYGGGGGGGAGGAGVLFTVTGSALNNSGSIVGGDGGAGGAGGPFGGTTGAPGPGGAGVIGGNLAVINSGSITGGLSSDDATRAPAIIFQGGANSLALVGEGSLTGSIRIDADEIGNPGGLTIASGAAGTVVTLPNVIEGVGSVTKADAGVLVLSGQNTYAGGTTISGGTLQVTNDSSLGSGGVTFQNNAVLQIQQGAFLSVNNAIKVEATGGTIDVNQGDVSFNGAIQGNGILTFTNTGSDSGAGVILLNGVNTSSGGSIVRAGAAVEVRIDNALGSGPLEVDQGGRVILTGRNQTVTRLTGGGSIFDAGDPTAAGSNTVNTLTVQSGIFSGDIDYGYTTSGDNFRSDGDINLVKVSDGSPSGGTLTLLSKSYYGGGTTLQAGTIAVGDPDALGTGTLTMSDGTTLQMAVNSDFALPNAIQLNGNDTFDTQGFALGLGLHGVLSGSGTLIKIGSFGLGLNATNTFSGGSIIEDGHLTLRNDAALGTGSVTFAGGFIRAGVDGLTIGNAAILQSSGTFDTQGYGLTYTGPISGGSALTKIGSGTLTLPNANTYTGGTLLQAGTIVVGNNASLGTGALSMSDGTTLQALDGLEIANSASLNGTATIRTSDTTGQGDGLIYDGVISGAGTLVKTGASGLRLTAANTYSGGTLLVGGHIGIANDQSLGTGPVTFAGGFLRAHAGGFTVSNAAVLAQDGTIDTQSYDLTYAGQISGAGALVKRGSGTLILTGLNSYTGQTRVNGGTLMAGAAGTFAPNSDVVLSGTTLDLNGYAQTVGSLAGSGSVTLGAATLTLGQTGASTTFTGEISGDGGLVKIGAGTFSPTGYNSYGGGTLIQGGTVVFSTSYMDPDTQALYRAARMQPSTHQNLPDTVGIVDAGGTIATSVGYGPVTLDGGTLQFASSYDSQEIANQIRIGTAGGTLDSHGLDAVNLDGGFADASAGPGSLVFTNTGAGGSGHVDFLLFRTSAFSGGSIVRANTYVQSDSDNAIGTGALQVDAGGVYDLGAFNQAVTRLTGQGSVVASGYAGAGILSTLTVQSGDFAGVLNDGTSTVPGETTSSSGFLGLTKVSDGTASGGTLVLAGQSLYSGPTLVSAGTLQAGSTSGFSPNSAVTVSGGATLDVAAFRSTVASLAGAGTVTNSGAVQAALVEGGSGADSTFSGTLQDGTAPLDLVKVGSGTLTLSGPNTYSGGTGLIGGTIAIGTAGSLGSGQLTFGGGTLRANVDGLRLGNTALLNQGGSIDTQGFGLTYAGIIAGPGGLAKLGSGVLSLTSPNSYAGGTRLAAGTLAITDGAALGTGALSMDEGTVLRLDADLTLGNAVVFTGVQDPTIDTGPNNDTMTGVISGPGALTKLGTGMLTLTAVNTFTGPTDVAAGTLVVNGSDASSAVTVASGATLGGHGTVGSVTAASGSTIAPGVASPYGTLSVGGSLGLASGSTLRIGIGPNGVNDKVAASGAASLGGASLLLVNGGGVAAGASYAFLTAAGGVSGSFGSVSTSTPLAFASPRLTYGPNSVSVALEANGVAFPSVGITQNQINVAKALQSLGPGSPLYNAILALTPDQARQAFDATSGAQHGSAQTVAQQDGRRVGSLVFDRLWTIGGGDLDARQLLDKLAPDEVPTFVRCFAPLEPAPKAPATVYSVWGEAFGDFGHDSGSGGVASTDRSLGGFVVGVDAPIHGLGAPTRIGVAAGYSNDAFGGPGSASNGTYESVFGSLYGGTRLGNVDIRLAGSASADATNMTRTVAFPGFAETERSSYGGNTVQGFGEIGYRFASPRLVLEPVAGGSVSYVHADGYREKGGAAALIGQAQDTTTESVTLGARGEAAPTTGVPLVARAFLGWRHTFGDINPISRLAFAAGSLAFTSQGAPIDVDVLAAEAGLDWRYNSSLTLAVSYLGQVGAHDSDNGVKGRVEYKF